MDWSNKEVSNNPNLSYTSRDYASILTELTNAIPHLTKLYNPQNEADPGVVLIKLMSMLGDMLSYNLDNNALEVFPKTVLQLKNAQQIFRLVGYKMRWYKSARCMAYFTNANSVPVSIGRYNTFTSQTGIRYTNLTQIDIPAGAIGNSQISSELVQGKAVTPPVKGTAASAYNSSSWHDIYGYNIDADSSVVNNRLYFTEERVDGTTIMLVDDDDTAFADVSWQQVENLNTVTEIGKYYEFDFDETGKPFIQLPDYWNTRYAITRFKLFYVVSDGEAGEIINNSLSQISADKVHVVGSSNVNNFMDNVHIYNSASTYGYSPETPEEAKKSAELFVNTIDTLVTLDDFTKATKRMTGVANAIATDKETDPDSQNMVNDQIKIYIIRKPGYQSGLMHDGYGSSEYEIVSDSLNDNIWKTTVVDELESYKLSKYNIQVLLEKNVDWIEWTIAGSIWLRQPIPSDKNHDIMVKINDNLDYTFSPTNLDFNEAINYIDVIDNIKSSDNLIYHVDLNSAAIQYSRMRRDTNGNPTGLTIESKWKIYDNRTGSYTNYYTTGFGCVTTPGGDGTQSNAGYRILRESGSDSISGLTDLFEDFGVSEFEIYNNVIYSWVQEERLDTGYYVHHDEDSEHPVIKKRINASPDSVVSKEVQYSGTVLDSNEVEVTLTLDSNGLPHTFKFGELSQIWDSNFLRISSIEAGRQATIVISDDIVKYMIVNRPEDYASYRYMKVSSNANGVITSADQNYILDSYTNPSVFEVSSPLDIQVSDITIGSEIFVEIVTDHVDPSTGVVTLIPNAIIIVDLNGEDTPYYFNQKLSILLSDGLASGEYLVTNTREIPAGIDAETGSTIYKEGPVYDIYDEYDDWTGRFIARSTGEIFILRNSEAYSMKRFVKWDAEDASGYIVDSFGDYVVDENNNAIYDIVGKEELTGRYEQTLELNPFETIEENGETIQKRSTKYEFYLGQDRSGEPLYDSVGNRIEAFPIKPDGFHVFIDTDRYILHDTGKGVITGTPGALKIPGSIDYTTGKVSFDLAIEPVNNMKIVFHKNTVAMARYNQFDPDTFYTQPQFLRYPNANRTLG